MALRTTAVVFIKSNTSSVSYFNRFMVAIYHKLTKERYATLVYQKTITNMAYALSNVVSTAKMYWS